MNFIAGGGACGVVTGLKPFKAGEGEPSVGTLQGGGMIFAPLENVCLPGSLLRSGGGERCESEGDAKDSGKAAPQRHEEVYRERECCGATGRWAGSMPLEAETAREGGSCSGPPL